MIHLGGSSHIVEMGYWLGALRELPWKTYVLLPRFSASQSHAPKVIRGRLERKTGRTLPGLPDGLDSDSLPRQILESLVGLVMPTNSLTAGTIGYIGVVPEQRGHGYSHDLLVHGTATLQAAGITMIR